ncbi:uncharacterized protein LOC144424329 isoform X2 [Styela clava]
MDNTISIIEKYKLRLKPEYGFRKIFRALQKLNEIEMTIELLQATGIGKSVNSLRKQEGLGEFAKEIVNKWKKLISSGNQQEAKSNQSEPSAYVPSVKSEPMEYDPTQNWEMEKTSPYKPSVKQERLEDSEYDPSQNWQMESSHDDPDPTAGHPYVPTRSPVKEVKTEKLSPPRQKKKKKRENGERATERSFKLDPGLNYENEEIESLHETHKEMKKRKKDKKRKNEMKIKTEKESPERSHMLEEPEVNGNIEEYDPHNNYELSPTTYDPSPRSDQEYDPSSQNDSIEYDPGPPDSDSINYKPSSNLTYDPGSSEEVTYEPGSPRVNEQLQNGYDSESSYEADEPGAYLLHPRRASSDHNRRLSETSAGQEGIDEPSDTSYVQSTTIYSRNKSIDSEDGNWGSKIKVENSEEVFSNERTENNKIKKKKHKKNENSNFDKKISEKHKTSEKRKSTNLNSVEPAKKKVKSQKEAKGDRNEPGSSKNQSSRKFKDHSSKFKNSEVGGDKNTTESTKNKSSKVKGDSSKFAKVEPKDAGFLFEDIPDVSKLRKKKKKRKNAQMIVPTVTKPSIKLDLHLPTIQPTYRPLPHSSDGPNKRRKSGEMKMTDNQAAELHSQRQTKKMLVYSGGSGGFIPSMMSLYDQCMGVLMNNIDAIDVFGGIPYEIINPVLKKCTWEQLYRLEDSNPYLLEDTDGLWKSHAQHEFRGKRPSELESWREMFLRLSDEREARLHNLTMMIQAKEAKKKPLEKKVQLAYVGTNAKAPRNVRRAQEKYGTGVRPRPSSAHSSGTSRSAASAVRREIVDSRMAIPEGTITAATVDREHRMAQIKEMKKPRVAPMMAKTLKSIGRLKFRR